MATKSPAFDEFHGLVHSSCEGTNANSTRLDLRVWFRLGNWTTTSQPSVQISGGQVARLDPMVCSFSRLSLVAPIEDTRVQGHAEILVARTTYFSPGLQKSTVEFWRLPFSQYFRRIKPPALSRHCGGSSPLIYVFLSADLPQSFSLS